MEYWLLMLVQNIAAGFFVLFGICKFYEGGDLG